MALDDILQAITAHTNASIADARSAHERRIADMRGASQREIEQKEREITEQKDRKMEHLRQKAAAYATTQIRHTTLHTKQRLIDEAYRSTVDALAKLPEARIEPLLRACMEHVPASGTIRPARMHTALITKLAKKGHTIGEPLDAAGGFIFISSDHEIDCTLETLTERVLRPATELETSASLFNA